MSIILSVTDTETTGVSEADQVVELAVVLTRATERVVTRPRTKSGRDVRWSSLIRPTCPVSPEGRAAHHLTDSELAEAPTMAELLERRGLPEFGRVPALDEEHVLVAHNAEFDLRMLAQSGVPAALLPVRTICTWRCAQHLFPNAPRHSNQVLRYHLGLIVKLPIGVPPHRALPDALVTQALVERMLETHTVDQLVGLTAQPVLQQTCRIGQYRDRPWSVVDIGFLRWIARQGPRRPGPGDRDVGFDEDVLFAARHWLEQREKES